MPTWFSHLKKKDSRLTCHLSPSNTSIHFQYYSPLSLSLSQHGSPLNGPRQHDLKWARSDCSVQRRVPIRVTLVPINYTPTIDQVKKSKDLLEDMTIRKYLDVLYDFSLLADDISLPSLHKKEYHNLIN